MSAVQVQLPTGLPGCTPGLLQELWHLCGHPGGLPWGALLVDGLGPHTGSTQGAALRLDTAVICGQLTGH